MDRWHLPSTAPPHGDLLRDVNRAGVLVSQGCHNKYREMGSLNNRNVLAHSSGAEGSEIKVLAGLPPSEGLEGRVCPRPPPWLADGHLLPVTSHSPGGLCPSLGFLGGHQSYWVRTRPNDILT